jgi:cytochrome c peroxidase
MHNGVFSSLEEVMDFYNRGGGIGLGLIVENQTLPATKLDLTAEEQQALIKFLTALSDEKK